MKSLDEKLERIRNGRYAPADFIIADAKDGDMEVNPVKAKQLTNIRAAGKDEAVKLTPPRQITLEYALTYIQEDELVEVTPQSIRLRKKGLDTNTRKKLSRAL